MPRERLTDIKLPDAWCALEPSIVALATGGISMAVGIQFVGAAMKVMTDQGRAIAQIDKKVERLLEGPLKSGKILFEQAESTSSEDMRIRLLNDSRLKFTEAAAQLTDELQLEAKLNSAMVFSLLGESELAKRYYTESYQGALDLNMQIHAQINNDAKWARRIPWVSVLWPLGEYLGEKYQKSAVKNGIRLFENEQLVNVTTKIMIVYESSTLEFNGVFKDITEVSPIEMVIKRPWDNSLIDSPSHLLRCARGYDIPWIYEGLQKRFFNMYTSEIVRTF